nr:MAG TPA: hypothetical protein [Caudoviricetes sp.]
MAKFTKPFLGVPDGEIYPVQYEKGDEVPAELLEAAKEAGVVGGKKGETKQPDDLITDDTQTDGEGQGGDGGGSLSDADGEGQIQVEDGQSGNGQVEQQ